METLVIVHLSSIESYITFYGSGPAQKLINDFREAIVNHPGPVILMDQEEEAISEEGRFLRQMIYDTRHVHPSITVFHHDEMCDISPWQDGMKAFARLVRQLLTHRVRLGGLWASQDAKSGCVHEVQRQLRARNIACYVDATICAFETQDRRATTTL